jgi:hypothetical protein
VKTRPLLPETDLARIAPLPTDLKWKALASFRVGVPPYSYKPVRTSIGDLLNLEAGMLGELPRVPFAKIAKLISERSKSDAEEQANLRVAAGLYAQEWRGRKEEFRPIATSIGEKLVYWTSAVLAVDGRPIVPFFNPRRDPLPRQARRFVFSIMHEQIRVANPDYKDVLLGICHFAKTKTGPRAAKLTFDTGLELFTFDQLDAMVSETYAIWNEVCAGRVAESRRRASGSGPLI